MSEMDASQLLQAIDTAFSATEYPSDENLVYDNSDTYCDVAKTKGDFRGKHWKELSIDTINYHRDDLRFLTAEAFCFYLPAFLRASVSYPIAVVDVLPDNLMLNLTPPADTDRTDTRLLRSLIS